MTRSGPLLPGAVELLPTPTSQAAKHAADDRGPGSKDDANLWSVTARLLPSPRATDGTKGSPNQRGSSGDLMLPSAVHELLRTPTAQLAVNGGSQHPDKRRAGGHQPTLADEVEWLLPTPMAADGWENPPAQPGSNTTRWGGVNSLGALAEEDFRPAGVLLPTPAAADGDRASAAYPRGNPTLAGALLPTPRSVRGASGTETMYALGGERSDDDRLQGEVLLPTPQVADVTGGHRSRSGARSDEPLLPAVAEQIDGSWGPYAAAIDRWAQVTGMEPPSPVEPGRNGKSRLSPRFVEWMQGLPAGWVTDVPGLSRNAKLKILGNGVVPQQAALALRVLALRVPWDVRVSRL